jgi:hypothetical protein
MLLLAVQHSAAALVAEGTWIADSECRSQLRVLMPQVRSARSARVAGVRLVPPSTRCMCEQARRWW